MKMKKMLFGAFLGMFTLAGVTALPVSAQHTTDWANPGGDDANVQEIGGQKLTGSALLDTIKNAINWLLGILATIALVICLYGGFLMVVSAGDSKKYESGLNVLKYAAIGLAIIGLSWMIVSVVFWFISTLGTNTASGQIEQVNNNGEGTSLRNGGNGSTANTITD